MEFLHIHVASTCSYSPYSSSRCAVKSSRESGCWRWMSVLYNKHVKIRYVLLRSIRLLEEICFFSCGEIKHVKPYHVQKKKKKIATRTLKKGPISLNQKMKKDQQCSSVSISKMFINHMAWSQLLVSEIKKTSLRSLRALECCWPLFIFFDSNLMLQLTIALKSSWNVWCYKPNSVWVGFLFIYLFISIGILRIDCPVFGRA